MRLSETAGGETAVVVSLRHDPTQTRVKQITAAQSQPPIRFAERNLTFDVAGRIHDANFARAEARATA